MHINKNAFLCCSFFIFYSIWSFYLYGFGKIGDFIVTPYDEYRYIEATSRLILDFKVYGLLYTFENYYNYSQSVHFGHYFVLAFIRYFFNDLMFFWSVYQNFIYCLGVFFFSKYLLLEYKFIRDEYLKYICILVFLYPVFYYLNFSLMRDISIFSLLSICLYLYRSNKYQPLFLFVLLLSIYRINVVLCLIVYIVIDQLKGKGFLSILKYLISSCFLILLINSLTYGFIFRNLSRINIASFSALFNETLVLLFSPLPYSIDPMLPGYIILWFKISFFICIFLISINVVFMFYRRFEFFVPKFSFIFFILLYVFIYSTEVGVGFRQASIVLPYIYVPILFYIFNLIQPLRKL